MKQNTQSRKLIALAGFMLSFPAVLDAQQSNSRDAAKADVIVYSSTPGGWTDFRRSVDTRGSRTTMPVIPLLLKRNFQISKGLSVLLT